MGRLRVVDADPLAVAVAWLDENLPAAVYVGESPAGDNRPQVLLRLDGGRDAVAWSTASSLGINVVCATLPLATELAREVKSWMEYMTHHPLCLESTCTAPAEVQTENRNQSRLYLAAQVTLTQHAPAVEPA